MTKPVVFCVHRVQLKGRVGHVADEHLAPRRAALVEQAVDAHGALRDKVERRLVVLVLNEGPIDLFPDVALLLELEDVLDEEIMK